MQPAPASVKCITNNGRLMDSGDMASVFSCGICIVMLGTTTPLFPTAIFFEKDGCPIRRIGARARLLVSCERDPLGAALSTLMAFTDEATAKSRMKEAGQTWNLKGASARVCHSH